MARKKKSNSTGSVFIFVILSIAFAITSIPKNAWVAIGLIAFVAAVIGGITWLVTRPAARQGGRVSSATRSRYSPPLERMHSEIIRPSKDESLSSPLPNISAMRSTTQKEPEFHTVQLGVPSVSSFSIPTSRMQVADARWIPAGESVTVAGFLIPGGMIYVGGVLHDYETSEPSLINPKLRITNSYVNPEDRLMSYWPSYDAISPDARRGYLQWLTGGRLDPLADTGYVFLFFYGLERRALVDAVDDSQAAADIPLIIDEVKRLLEIYGENRSFRGYATALLNHVDGNIVDPNSYLSHPPQIVPNSYEMPLSLRIGLGQHAANKHPVNAGWAFAWALADPNIGKRTPVARCSEVFETLFKLRYASFHPGGLLLSHNKTKLKASYRPASAVLRIPATSIDDLPDVMATSGTRKILQRLVDVCTAELEPYSRYLGRNPESAETLEGLLQLPVMLWPNSARAEFDDLEAKIGEDLIVMSFGELAGRFKSAGALSRDKVLALARALECRHIGIEPDVLAGSRTPKAADKIALFVAQPEDGALRASAAYNAASVTLDLASAVASADGDTSLEEMSLLSQHIDSWSHLSVAHQKRLKAHLQIQIQQPPTLASLKKRLGPLPSNAKRTIASFLAHLAQADGIVSPSEVKLLERVYKALQLDSQLLYSDLHGAAAGVASYPARTSSLLTPAAVRPATPSESTSGFTLDHDRIAQLQQETAAVSALLAKVFTDEDASQPAFEQTDKPGHDRAAESDGQPPVSFSSQTTAESNADISGLDLEHSAFLRLLVSRTEWSRSELEAAASDMELMLDGALEQINDMAFDRFDMPVTEGDDPVEINADILEELAL